VDDGGKARYTTSLFSRSVLRQLQTLTQAAATLGSKGWNAAAVLLALCDSGAADRTVIAWPLPAVVEWAAGHGPGFLLSYCMPSGGTLGMTHDGGR